MEGSHFQLGPQGISEELLEEKDSSRFTFCCDACSPFSDSLKETAKRLAKAWLEEALPKAQWTKEELIQSLRLVNERLRSHFKKDKRRLALSIVLVAEQPTANQLFVFSCGDIHLTYLESNHLQVLHKPKHSSNLPSERERLKYLNQTFIRSATPHIEVSTLPAQTTRGMGLIPQSLYHCLTEEEIVALLQTPSNLQMILDQRQILLPHTEVVICKSANTLSEQIQEEMNPQSIAMSKESQSMTPSGLPKPSQQKSPKRKMALSLTVGAMVIAGGAGLYQLMSGPSPTNQTSSQPVATHSPLENQTEQTTLVQQLKEENRSLTQEVNQLEVSLREEVEKSQFLRDALNKEMSKQEKDQSAVALLEEKISQLEVQLEEEQRMRKAARAMRLHAITGLKRPEEQEGVPLSLPEYEISKLRDEKATLESKLADLALQHDNLVAENQLLTEQIETQHENTPSLDPSATQENVALKQRVETLESQLAKESKEGEYYQISYEALKTELERQREKNTLLQSEVHSQKQAYLALLQDQGIARPLPKLEPTQKEQPPAPNKTEESLPEHKSSVVHVVQKGETLSEISMLYYGSSKQWKKILQANKEKVPTSNLVIVGTELVIPEPSVKGQRYE